MLELEMEGIVRRGEGSGNKGKKTRHTLTADAKISHALLCEYTQVLGERDFPGSVSCSDLQPLRCS